MSCGAVYSPGEGTEIKWSGRVIYAYGGSGGNAGIPEEKNGMYDWSMMFGAEHKTEKMGAGLELDNHSIYSDGSFKGAGVYTGRTTVIRLYLRFFL